MTAKTPPVNEQMGNYTISSAKSQEGAFTALETAFLNNSGIANLNAVKLNADPLPVAPVDDGDVLLLLIAACGSDEGMKRIVERAWFPRLERIEFAFARSQAAQP